MASGFFLSGSHLLAAFGEQKIMSRNTPDTVDLPLIADQLRQHQELIQQLYIDSVERYGLDGEQPHVLSELLEDR